VRRKVAADQRVDRESARLRDELDLVGVEMETRLHVRARDGENRLAREIPGQHAMDVPRDHPPDLRMTPQNIAKRAPVVGR
jgi:hypothetical protein